MKNVKKAFVLLVAILAIVVFTRNVNAAAISTNKTNNTANNTTNSATNNAANTVVNNTQNEVEPSQQPVNNAYQPINTSNAAENIPKTGIEDSYFNFALILLLTLVLGTFSLVQYNKIIKKDQE